MLLLLALARPAAAYSVLAHESNIDAWRSRCRRRRRKKLFLDSPLRTRSRFRTELEALRRGRLELPNINLDTGKVSAPGEYRLADETRTEWQKRHAVPKPPTQSRR